MPVIEVSHLTKEYRLGALQGLKQQLINTGARLIGRKVPERPLFKALDDVSFSIEQGEVVGIIGHNGAGKSTLLKMLARISTPTSGSVKAHGRIAPLIEVGAGFVPDFTGRENIYLNGAILGMSKHEIDKKFEEIVDFAEMAEFIDTPVKRYSSGMQVKLAFAVATSIESEILIVDEVLAVGDLAFQRKCFDRMEDLIRRQGRTVLLVSHNIRQVERMCDRVLLLDHGRTLMDSDAKTVCNEFYARSDLAIHKNQSSKARDARNESTDDVQLLALKTLDSKGKESNIFQCFSEIHFLITFRISKSIKMPIFGVGFHTTDFVYLATNQSINDIIEEGLEPGEYNVHFTVNRLPFLPGPYAIRIGVARGDFFQALLYQENVQQILIESGSENRAITSNPGEGFIAIEGHWRLDFVRYLSSINGKMTELNKPTSLRPYEKQE